MRKGVEDTAEPTNICICKVNEKDDADKNHEGDRNAEGDKSDGPEQLFVRGEVGNLFILQRYFMILLIDKLYLGSGEGITAFIKEIENRLLVHIIGDVEDIFDGITAG